MLLVLAGSQAPGIQVLDFQYVLLLHPATVFFTDAFLATGADGKTTIPLPPFPTGLVHVHALVHHGRPELLPGLWTNPLAL